MQIIFEIIPLHSHANTQIYGIFKCSYNVQNVIYVEQMLFILNKSRNYFWKKKKRARN